MDPAAPPAPTATAPDEDDWDAEGFEIPSLNTTKKDAEKPPVESLKPVLSKPIITQTENLYLGPHGAKPGLKPQQQQDLHSSGKRRFKHRIRDVDQLRGNSFGRENKVEVLRDLMGSKSVVTPRSSSSGGGRGASWLDPHCQESLFERSSKARKP